MASLAATTPGRRRVRREETGVFAKLFLASLMLLTLQLFVAAFELDSLRAPLNTLCPVTLIIACCWAAFLLARRDPLLVWTPIVWFLARFLDDGSVGID